MFTGAVTEGDAGDTTRATGTLAIVDSDSAVAPSFADVASMTAANGYGTFALSSGVWTYTLDQATVQDLDAGDTVTDTFTLIATGGTPQAVSVTIIGNNTFRNFSENTVNAAPQLLFEEDIFADAGVWRLAHRA